MLRITRIADESDWLHIEPQWKQLLEDCPDTTPFQSFEWLFSWWQTFGRGELVILVGRDERAEVIGIAPFFVESKLLLRVIRCLGEGPSDYLNLILRPDRAQECLGAFLSFLLQECSPFILTVPELPAFSTLNRLSTTLARIETVGPVCPVLELPAEWEQYTASLSQNQRRHLRKAGKRLSEICIEAVDPESLSSALPELFRLHEKRWRSRGEPGVLEDARVREFHSAFVERAKASGLVRIYVLRVRETIAAIWYGFTLHSRAYFYLSGMDPEFDHASPGSAVMGFAIRQAILDGASHFDFLRGAEPYKDKWRAESKPRNRRVVLFSHSTLKSAYSLVSQLRSIGRRLAGQRQPT